MFQWGELGLIQVCGKNAASVQAVVDACKAIAGHPGVVRLQDFVINTDVIVLSTPEIAGLPYVISGLVAAGGLAAALSTADGLLLAIANALSHDVYYKMIDPNAPTVRRLTVARVLLLVVAVAAAATAATKPGDILAMVGWAFSLAMAGNFPALIMGIWWKRTTAAGAVAGMLAGFGLALFYLVVSRYFPGFGVKYAFMTSLTNPAGAPLVANMQAAMAAPNAMDAFVAASHPLANKVGWFNLNNIASGLLAHAGGFLDDLRRQPDGQRAVEGNAGLRRRDPPAAWPHGSRRKDLIDPNRVLRQGPSGPCFFLGERVTRYNDFRIVPRRATIRQPMGNNLLLTHWYFQVPNFVLAALMYTLLGRALLGLMVQPDSNNYIWRAFCRLTDPVVAAVSFVTPKATAPVVVWLFGVVWLFWLRVALLIFVIQLFGRGS